MSTYGYDLQNEEDVKQYLHNIGIEYRFGCYSEQKPEVCHLLGMYMEVIKNNVEQAKKVFKVNCDNFKWDFSCYRYAYLLDREKQADFKEEVLDYYTKGCEAGNVRSCFMTGVKIGAKAEKEPSFDKKLQLYNKALEYMDSACTNKLGQACFNLATVYITGLPDANIQRDLSKAANASVRGCESLHFQSCVNASFMYLKGDGVPRDIKKSRLYRKKANELHSQMNEEGLKFEEGLSNT